VGGDGAGRRGGQGGRRGPPRRGAWQHQSQSTRGGRDPRRRGTPGRDGSDPTASRPACRGGGLTRGGGAGAGRNGRRHVGALFASRADTAVYAGVARRRGGRRAVRGGGSASC